MVAAMRRRAFTPPAANMPDHPWLKGYQDMKPLSAPSGVAQGARISMPRSPLRPERSAKDLAGLRYDRGHGNPTVEKRTKQQGHF